MSASLASVPVPGRGGYDARQEARLVDWFLGMSYGGLFSLWLAVTFVFAVAYFLLAAIPGEGPSALTAIADPVARFWNAVYFSIITGTTTGYGDIVPAGLSKALAALQSLTSFIVLALCIAKFGSRRQELTLEHIHRLSFDSLFHTFRNGLFIARKDLDLVLKALRAGDPLQKKDWTNFRTAIRQTEIFIKLVPDFYAALQREESFDADREMLLFDAIERTLGRLTETLALLAEKGISLSGQPSAAELGSLTTLAEHIFADERRHEPDPENRESLSEIIRLVHNVRKRARELA